MWKQPNIFEINCAHLRMDNFTIFLQSAKFTVRLINIPNFLFLNWLFQMYSEHK